MTDLLLTEFGQMAKAVLDPNSRLFAGYLLGALLIGLLVTATQFGLRGQQGAVRQLFNRKIWLHRSARLDYQLYVINRLIRALLWAPIVLTMVPIALGISDALESVFGYQPPVTQNSVIVISAFTLILFLFDDFTRFLLHWMMHKIPFLWHFHKVHHSALVLTPMTVYRSHPVESFLYATRMAIAQGFAVGISYYFFGTALSMFDILGANALVFAFNMLGSNLRHSHVKWRWGKLEKWFISPVQHQIHHSTNPKHFDKNFGTALAVWDRMFGSLVLSKRAMRLRFGLGRQDAGHHNVVQAYTRPFHDIGTSAIGRFRQNDAPERGTTPVTSHNDPTV
ncbi:sterol desaturase family protein [Salinimonas iocasae]|uniref:Sterol desaturase family protein n=1 Tax=Salinimonas iocasae TaxID=2572577 RepID=A0A5B7YC88_9ALTE|nr:sterol desaturase family protein [Salinimonas iocasae]QCZ92863.1 sterol desaturase family protein [Salinimonas iocasae]